MKKEYTTPDFELITLTLKDVILSSQGNEDSIPVETDPFDPGDPGGDLLL